MTDNTNDESKKTPVEKFNEGPVQVAVWENEGPRGLFRVASFQLRYKAGEEWKTGTSYGSQDLQNLEKAAKGARERIEGWKASQPKKPDVA